jgi:hypothetical protein
MAKISIAESFSCQIGHRTCDERAKEFINEEVPEKLNNYTCNATSVNNHKALLVICSGEKKKTSKKNRPGITVDISKIR